jgi:hypothetical protein
MRRRMPAWRAEMCSGATSSPKRSAAHVPSCTRRKAVASGEKAFSFMVDKRLQKSFVYAIIHIINDSLKNVIGSYVFSHEGMRRFRKCNT